MCPARVLFLGSGPALLALLLLGGCDEGGRQDSGLDAETDQDGDGFFGDVDCDDSDPSVYPDAEERCNGLDNNCDGEVDNGATDKQVWNLDGDGDGYGTGAAILISCAPPSGYVDNADDCDDTLAVTYPGADELCDHLDNDCDGELDEEAVDKPLWHIDADLDGYGDAHSSLAACEQPDGHLADESDCDDSDPLTSPDGLEYCDGQDNNCDGTVDEDAALDALTWYADTDGDGEGDPESTTQACAQPSGYVPLDLDCDDGDPTLGQCASCTISALSSPTTLVDRGSKYGAWMADPLETLGAGMVWEMDGFNASALVQYPSQARFLSGSASATTTLPYPFNGTGGVVYDGKLYYNRAATNQVVQYDLSTGASALLDIPDAGSHNTYEYSWGGYSDIDLSVDEQGLWVIYSTAANGGKLVVSQIDPSSLSIVETHNTNSALKTAVGNAFMVCGVLYASGLHSADPGVVDYSYDTVSGRDSSLWLSLEQPGRYNTMISYNPSTGLLYTWDDGQHNTYVVSY